MQKKEIMALIIEDSPSDVELFREKTLEFKTLSCVLASVARVSDAEKMLEMNNYDVIFLDLNLPDSRGLDTVMKINEKRKNAPVIIMTGAIGQDLDLKALNIGAQNFIIKGEETAASLERTILFSMEREKNIQEILKSKKIQEEIIKNSPVMMFVLDETGRVVSMNPETEKFSGKSSEGANGFRSGSILDCINSFKDKNGCGYSKECETCPLAAAVKEVLSTGRSVRNEEIQYEVKRGNKTEEKVLLTSIVRLPINSGYGALVSVEDMTEMKDAERNIAESERKFSAAFNSGPAGTMITRFDDGKIIECNAALELRFGFTREEIIGKTTIELGLWASKDERKTIIERIGTGKPVAGIEVSFRSKTGEKVPCLYSAALLEINSEKCVISTLADLSEQRKAETELIESEEKFRSAFEQAAVGMAFVSGDGRFMSVNSRFCEITGYTKEEMEKLKFRDISCPGTLEKDLQAVKDMIEGKTSVYKTEKQYVRKNGSLIWIDLTVAPVRNQDSTFKYFVAVYEDISARKQAEGALRTSEEKWEAFTDSANDMLTIWDDRLKLVAANKAAYDEYKAIADKNLVLKKNMLELGRDLKLPPRYRQFLSLLRSGTPVTSEEYGFTDAGGEYKTYSFKAFKLAGGMGLIISNITELKRSEIVLKRSFEKLKEVDRLKSNFISIISHELRTPLTIIKGFTSFLTKEAAGPLNDTQKNFANTIDLNTVRLARIINDMVDVSKIESGSFSIEKEQKDLAGVINESVDGMRHIAGENGVNIEIVTEVKSAPAEIDKGRIMQTITNLINNAIRFSRKGGTITVGLQPRDAAEIPQWAVEKTAEEKNYYFMYVGDDGAGMEKKYLEKIFERFFQVENANVRKHQGAGLGLSIAKSIVEAHDGFIWAESAGIGKGSKICILLPE